MRPLVLATFMLFLSTIITAQQFQRNFDPGRISPGLDLDQPTPDELAILSFVAGANLFSGGFLNLSTLGLNNGQINSYDLRLNGIAAADGRACWWPSQNCWLVGMAALDNTQNKSLFRINNDWSLDWVKRFGEPDDIQSVNIGRVAVAVTPDDKAVLAGAAANFGLNDGRNDLFVAKINPDGSSVWEKQYRFSLDNNADAALGGMIVLPDGSLVISGTVNKTFSASDNLFLLKTDAAGNLLWAKEYGTSGTALGAKEKGLDVCLLPNGHIVMNGWVDENLASNQDGLLLETDAFGNPLRALSIDVQGGDFNLQINRVLALDEDRVVFSAGAWENIIPTDALELNIMAEVSLNGNIAWQHHYFDEILVGYGTPGDALLAKNADGGYFMLANDAFSTDYLRPVLIGTNLSGQTGCEKTVSLQINTNRVFTAKDLSPTVVIVNTNQAADANSTIFEGYVFNLPFLELGADTSLCAPAQLLLNADTPGADTYTWNTGADTPVLEVDSSGLYAVTVRSEAECFTLRDSVTINISGAPAVTIRVDSSRFCTTGLLTLQAQSIPDADIRWSNGQTGDSITIATVGTYAASVENECGADTDTAEVFLPECPGSCLFYVPNAFTPNDDGVNDLFGPFSGDCVGLRRFHFRVYNRWGALVFESRNPDSRWNGVAAGRQAASDVYVWQLDYETGLGQSVRQSGDVSLLR